MAMENVNLAVVSCPELKTKLEAYAKQEFRSDAIAHLNHLLSDYKTNEATLKKDFGSRLEFGTAGLRGPMKVAGTNVMNVLTVLQTSQGVAKYLEKREGRKDLHIVIGYDGRYNSREFAEYASAAMLANGFTVSLFGSSHSDKDTVTPTPFTPYYLIKNNCDFGIQVTASHNPKDDNGYKVYDKNGAQIIPPVDADIAATIEEPCNLEKWAEIDSIKQLGVPLTKHERLRDPYTEVMEAYFGEMQQKMLTKGDSQSVKVVYTAMHGVGSIAVRTMAKTIGFNMENFFVVEEQDTPNPEFPTVSFPNPEEAGALDMAMAKADSVGALLVVANDPDADRFAMCEKIDGQWHRYTGDEIGVILSHIVLESALARGVPVNKCLMACSAVSSGMMRTIGEARGATVIDTLTGFKWIMNEGMKRAKEDSLEFIYGYEEALGYACNLLCPDKDGVSASGIMLQYYQVHGEGCFSRLLADLRKQYGHFVSNNCYVLCHDKAAVNQMFAEFRADGKYREAVGEFKIERVRDVTTGYDNGEADLKCRFPLTPGANMITLYFSFGRITIRTSGTEPKLKWYAEGSGSDPVAVSKTLETLVFAVIDEIFHPEKYPLEKVPTRA